MAACLGWHLAVTTAAPVPAPATGSGPIDGRRLFLKNCAPCHGPDGRARTPAARKLGVKDLTVNRLEDAQIRQQIREGVQATGTSGKMPAFKESFHDEELSALVAEVKRLRKPGGGG